MVLQRSASFWRNVKHHPLHSCVPLWRSFRISIRLHRRTHVGGGGGWVGVRNLRSLLLMLTYVLILKSLPWSESPAEQIYIPGKASFYFTPGAADGSSFHPPITDTSCHVTLEEEFRSHHNSWKHWHWFAPGPVHLLKRRHLGVLEVRRSDTMGQPLCCDICRWQAWLLSGGLGGCWLTL